MACYLTVCSRSFGTGLFAPVLSKGAKNCWVSMGAEQQHPQNLQLVAFGGCKRGRKRKGWQQLESVQVDASSHCEKLRRSGWATSSCFTVHSSPASTTSKVLSGTCPYVVVSAALPSRLRLCGRPRLLDVAGRHVSGMGGGAHMTLLGAAVFCADRCAYCQSA